MDFSTERFHAMASCPGTYYLIVIENTELAKIVACGTLVVEQKYIHEIAVVCTVWLKIVHLSQVFKCFYYTERDLFLASRFCLGGVRVEKH